MDDNEALQIMSAYIQGCGGKLCAGWRAYPHWIPKGDREKVYISATPPQDFRPAGGQQWQKGYANLRQVAIAMGLQPDDRLAASVTAPACARRNDMFRGAKKSSRDPQNRDKPDPHKKRRTPPPNAGIANDPVAALGSYQVSEDESLRAYCRSLLRPPQSGLPPIPHHKRSRNAPVQMPQMQPGMRSSRSSSSLEVQPDLAENALSKQRNIAAAEQPNLAANPGSWHLPANLGNPGSWQQPNVAPASGTQQSPSGQHCNRELERLQKENRDLKERNATLNRKVRSLKDQRSQQGAREEEMRAQQLALTQTLSHLVNENDELKAELRSKSPVNQDASCSDRICKLRRQHVGSCRQKFWR